MANIIGTSENDNLNGTNGADTIRGLGGNDRVSAGSGNDLVFGGGGNDDIDGGQSADILYGDNGDASAIGGNDTINGGQGADLIFGEAGDDIIIGGQGADVLSGGAGNDVFVFNAANESTAAAFDVISDFRAGQDKINLVALLGAATDLAWGGQNATINGVWYQQGAGDTTVLADTNGDGVADLRFVLTGLHNLSAADFRGVSSGGAPAAPVNSVPGLQTTLEDAALILGGSNAISVADADSATLTVTLTASNGTLTLAQLAGLVFSSGDGLGDGTMTFSGTVANINAALDGLSFLGNTNTNGAASIQIATSDGAASDTDTVLIAISPVNDAPVNAGLVDITTSEDTPVSISGLSVNDVDAAGAGQICVTLSATAGSGFISVSGAAAAGVTVASLGDGVELTGSLGQINALLSTDGAVRFNPAPNFAGSSTLTMTSNDQGFAGAGGVLFDTDAVTITITSSNDAPSGTDATLTTDEDTPYTLALADFGFDDLEGNAFAAVRLATLPSTGILLLSGVAAVAGQFVAAADITAGRLVYRPGQDFTGGDTFTFQVQDDGGTANGGVALDASPNTLGFSISPVNDSPVNRGLAPITTDEDTPLFISGLRVDDVDAATAPGAFGAPFRVTLNVTAGAGQVNVFGAGAAGIAVNNSPTGVELIGSLAQINALLATAGAVQFAPATNFFGSAELTMTSNDQGFSGSGGALVDSDTVGITVRAVNDAPTGTDTLLTVLEDTARTLTLQDFGFSDLENNAFVAVKLTTLPALGTVLLNGLGVSAGHFISAADIGAGALVYHPAPNATLGDSLTFQVRDDGGTANAGVDLDPSPNTIAFSITAVNDAPVNAELSALVTNEDTPVFITGLSISDVDATAGGSGGGGGSATGSAFRVTLGVSSGAGNVDVFGAAAAGVTVVESPDGVTLVGSLPQINQLLGTSNAVRFTPTTNFAGSADLTMTVDDQGFSGAGGALTDTDATSITVVAVNDAPSGADNTLTLDEDTPRTLALADFGFSDLENNAFVEVRLTTLPALGALTLNNVAVSAGQLVSAADINAGLLVFRPAQDSVASETLTFQVRDDGGTSNGGVDLDPTPNALSFLITPVNDAAVITSESPNGFSGSVVENGAVAGVPTTGGNLYATDVDNADDLWQPVAAGTTSVNGFGTYQLDSTGRWTYTLDNAHPAVDALNTGQTLTDTLTLRTVDGTAATVTITINGASESNPPVAANDRIITSNTTAVIPEWALLFNDSDPDGDAIDVARATAISGAGDTVVHAPGTGTDGTVTFDDGGSNGGSFAYVAVDAFGVESVAPATASIQVDISGSLDGGVAGGLSGNQILVGSGTSTNEQIFGGDGDDILLGGLGPDTYRFDLDDGTDIIWDSSTGGQEQARFETGSTSTLHTLNAERIGNDLKLSVESTTVMVRDHYAPAGSPAGTLTNAVDSFFFARDTGAPALLLDGHSFAAGQRTFLIETDLDGGNTSSEIIASSAAGETLNGLDGDDLLFGNGGADTLNGGLGTDYLVGGAGTDTFDFNTITASPSTAVADLIADFEIGLDKIDLLTIDANATSTTFNDAFSAALIANLLTSFSAPGQLRFGYSSATNETIVQANVDANLATVEFEIHLIGNYTLPGSTLAPSDFIL